MQSLVGSIRHAIRASQRLEQDLLKALFGGPPFSSGSFLESSLVGSEHFRNLPNEAEPEPEDKKSEAIVWAVPKKRTSVEKRWCKQMGAKNWYWKMLIPKYNIRICDTCGHHYEAKHLCRNCYERVKSETEVIRKKIEADLGNTVEDKGVIVLYENERESLEASKSAIPKGHMLVEVPKPRPAWFSSNLLQKTTAVPDPVTTTVATTKPNLG